MPDIRNIEADFTSIVAAIAAVDVTFSVREGVVTRVAPTSLGVHKLNDNAGNPINLFAASYTHNVAWGGTTVVWQYGSETRVSTEPAGVRQGQYPAIPVGALPTDAGALIVEAITSGTKIVDLDGQRTEKYSLAELLAMDKYLRDRAAIEDAAANPRAPFKMYKLVPPGANGV